ncbi:MAG: tyrosine-type recombinase/integrase [Pseudoxanthomonas sp.]
MADLSTVRSREALKPQREPYWHKLATGQFLGFRPSTIGKGGTWIARYYDPDTRRKPLKALGDFGNLPASDRFGAASQEARDWFKHLSRGGSEDDVTVREACERYATDNPDAAGRFARYVYSDPIAPIKLRKLRKTQVAAWRARLETRPALVTRNKGGDRVTRPRSAATLNRDMSALRAALYAAMKREEVETANAWRDALAPVENAGKRRNLYLDKEQRRALLAAMPADAVAFFRGLSVLPLRPGALAGLKVGDFEARTGTLAIDRDKAGKGRQILLPASTAAMLKEQTRGKLPGAPLFMRADGKAWDKDAWKHPIKDAANAADLPASCTAYTLRHSTITDLVVGGLDLLTVAQISGTSVAMIEKHYGHLNKARAAAALAALVL